MPFQEQASGHRKPALYNGFSEAQNGNAAKTAG